MGDNFSNIVKNKGKMMTFSNLTSHSFWHNSLENKDRSLLIALKTAPIIPLMISDIKYMLTLFRFDFWAI